MADYLIPSEQGPEPSTHYMVPAPQAAPPVSPAIAQDRAKKYDTAMGTLSPGVDQLATNIQTGAEDSDRLRLAQSQMIQDRQTKLQLLDEYVQQKGAPASPEEMDTILNLTKDEMGDPQSIMEKLYARKALSGNLLGGDNPTLHQGLQDDPEGVHTTLDSAEDMLARKEGYQRILESLQAQAQDQGWVDWGWDIGEGFVPGVTWHQLNTAVEGAPKNNESLSPELPGDSKKSQYTYLNELPVDQAIKEAQGAADKLSGENLRVAIDFFTGLLDYSSSSRTLDNLLIGGGDLATGAGVAAKLVGAVAKGGTVAAKVAKGVKPVASAAKTTTKTASPADFVLTMRKYRAQGMSLEEADAAARKELDGVTTTTYDAEKATPKEMADKAITDTTEALLQPKATTEAVLNAAGHTEEAAELGAVAKLRRTLAGGVSEAGEPGGLEAIRNEVPSIFNTESWISTGAKNFAREAQRRIVDAANNTTPDILKAITAGVKIDRLSDSPELIDAMISQAKGVAKREYPELTDTILDARHNVVSTGAGDVHQVAIQFGDENANLFKTRWSAINWAKEKGLRDIRIKQQGAGFYIEAQHTVDETSTLIRSIPIETDAQTPRTLSNMFVSSLIGPENKLSKISREDRKTTVYGVGELTALLKNSAQQIGSIGKKSAERLRAFLDADRVYETTTTVNGLTRKEVGRFANSLEEFETRWHDLHGQFPSEKEAIAYFQYVRLSDLDWVMRNFRLYRDKARIGIRTFDFKHNVKTVFKGVEGKTVDDIPWESPDDAGVLVLREGGEPTFFHKNDAIVENKATVEKLKTEGYRLIQVSDFGENSLKTQDVVKGLVGDDKIHFVLTRNLESRPLSLKQLPKRPGGHVAYPDGWYIGQPKITEIGGVNRYSGDTNLMLFTSEAQARKFSSAYDQVRQMLKTGVSEATIDDFINKNLSKTPAEVKALFRPKLDEAGKIIEKPALSLDHPIDVRFSGESLADRLQLQNKYANFKDSRKDPFNLYANMNLEYAGTRNSIIDTIEESGSETNPIFKTRPAKMIDPMTTLNRGVVDMMKARFIDDLKTKETEKFLNEFGHTLNVNPQELARNPFKYLFDPHPQWNEALDRRELTAAKSSLQALKQFIGTETEWSKNLRWVKQKVLNSLYNQFGEKGVDFGDKFLLYTTNDPVKYARALAFHAKLGLFNPVQMFLQAQQFVHVTALAGPLTAAKAAPGALLMRGLRFTDKAEVIDSFANHASKFGWRKDDFIEAYNALRNSGMDRVAGEVAMRDDVYDPQIVQTALGKFSEWSTFFFNEGERFGRMSAFNAAYLEWRGANAGAKFTDKIARQVLERADLYAGNMTRASSAAWQQGFASIPTQFFAYQARIAEQLLGKRLTAAEKFRVMGMYSLIYGLPVGAAAGTLWPWGDTLRKQLIDRGIDYDDNVISRTMMDGIVSVLIQAATGTKYNVGERYGPGGLNTFRDWLTGDKNGIEILTGVSGSSIYNMTKSMWPVLTDIADVVRGDPDGWPNAAEDMADFTKEISSANNLIKMMYGLNYGKYITKNEINMTDVTPLQSIFMGLEGLTPQSVSDAFFKQDIQKDIKAAKAQAEKDAVKYIRRAMRSGDPDDQARNMARVRALIEGTGMTLQERSKVFQEAMDGWQSFVDAQEWSFAKSSPEHMQQFIDQRSKQP